MNNSFYRAFEEKHRGPRRLIKSRLEVYLPFIEPLSSVSIESVALDLGCGRGEWLEILEEAGYKANGVDLDAGMLQACRDLDLKVELGDAFEHLIKLTKESLTVISAFHFVEHISFEQLQTLVKESLRVLKPGGLLILETPNPENIVVATRNFYLDPTHQKPIPPELLNFVVEHAGFAVVKTLRLQESKGLLLKNNINMQDVFNGVSPDYAVVAQKRGPNKILNLLSNVFDQNYGVNLESLLVRWDDRFEHAELKADQAQAKAEHAELKADQAQAKAEHAELKADQAQARADQANLQLKAVYASKSWRVSMPLRWVSFQFRLLQERGATRRTKDLAKKTLLSVIVLVEANPRLKSVYVALEKKLGLVKFIKKLCTKPNMSHTNSQHDSSEPRIENRVQMSPRARQIKEDLRLAMTNQIKP
jgi:O-antigen chain-terminating methyltransferase